VKKKGVGSPTHVWALNKTGRARRKEYGVGGGHSYPLIAYIGGSWQ
jgi:hypothetical protein